MSTIIMAACWPLKMTAPQKSVLISLADQANDDGVCWPSIATISRRTCLSERAVQEAIAWLEAAGAVSRDFRHNRSTYYTITPEQFDDEHPPTSRRRKSVGEPAAPSSPNAGAAPSAPGGAGGAPGDESCASPDAHHAHPEPLDKQQLTVIEPSRGRALDGETPLQLACRATWAAYAQAYADRHGAPPVRNQKINAQVKQFVQRLGHEEAPLVAAFYLSVNELFVVRRMHDFGLLLNQAEGYRTQWATGRSMTATRASQIDKTQSNYDAAGDAKAMLRARRGTIDAE